MEQKILITGASGGFGYLICESLIKNGHQVLYISSLLGRMTLPFYGPYNATKWALEALAENYRTELSGFGIESLIVEPGGFPTTFIDNLIKPSDKSQEPSYGEFMQVPEATLGGLSKHWKRMNNKDLSVCRSPFLRF